MLVARYAAASYIPLSKGKTLVWHGLIRPQRHMEPDVNPDPSLPHDEGSAKHSLHKSWFCKCGRGEYA